MSSRGFHVTIPSLGLTAFANPLERDSQALQRTYWGESSDQRCAHEPKADDVSVDPVPSAFLGDRLAQADQAMFSGHICGLEHLGFLGMNRTHVDDAAAATG